MCGCKVGAKFDMEKLRGEVKVTMSQYKDSQILNALKYAYCLSPETVRAQFSEVGVDVNSEDDLSALATAAQSNLDTSGKFGDKAFSVREVLTDAFVKIEMLIRSGKLTMSACINKLQ
jgi:hypothetical protein